jgi:hypothetical protein
VRMENKIHHVLNEVSFPVRKYENVCRVNFRYVHGSQRRTAEPGIGVGDAQFLQPSWTECEHSLVYINVWNRELFLTERSRK